MAGKKHRILFDGRYLWEEISAVPSELKGPIWRWHPTLKTLGYCRELPPGLHAEFSLEQCQEFQSNATTASPAQEQRHAPRRSAFSAAGQHLLECVVKGRAVTWIPSISEKH